MPIELPVHGKRRFWNTLEGRYFRYRRPELIQAVCTRCTEPLTFIAKPLPMAEYDEHTGGWRVLRGEICGTISGRGGCARCGHIVHALEWPEQAYLKVQVPEGVVWAWNESFLPVLLARVVGDKVAVRQLEMEDRWLEYFVARIPKFALVTKNRDRFVSGFTKLSSALHPS